jgi:ribosomal protein S18 acetylase RimI-like enzyme
VSGSLVQVIEMRLVGPEDWRVWRELRLAALAEAPDAFGSRLADWQGEGDREERWRARLAVPGSRSFVALRLGEPVGMVGGVPGETDGVVELVSMWVGREARGLGVGDRLVGAVAEWAAQVGAEALELAVRPGNERAIALYRRNGFTDTGRPGDVVPESGLRERIMAKPITPS